VYEAVPAQKKVSIPRKETKSREEQTNRHVTRKPWTYGLGDGGELLAMIGPPGR
jgi:hypothetical protein